MSVDAFVEFNRRAGELFSSTSAPGRFIAGGEFLDGREFGEHSLHATGVVAPRADANNKMEAQHAESLHMAFHSLEDSNGYDAADVNDIGRWLRSARPLTKAMRRTLANFAAAWRPQTCDLVSDVFCRARGNPINRTPSEWWQAYGRLLDLPAVGADDAELVQRQAYRAAHAAETWLRSALSPQHYTELKTLFDRL